MIGEIIFGAGITTMLVGAGMKAIGEAKKNQEDDEEEEDDDEEENLTIYF